MHVRSAAVALLVAASAAVVGLTYPATAAMPACATAGVDHAVPATSPAGVSAAGVSRAGVSAAGVSWAGVSAAGASWAGVSAAGASRAGASPAGASLVALSLAEPGDPVKWYRVRPSFDGQEEYLFEIAERFLGDGDRLTEIFELNKGRLQPDGQRLTVPDQIESGWVLQLPPDAEGTGVEFGPLPTAAPSQPAVAPSQLVDEGPKGGGGSMLLWILLGLGVLLIAAGLGLAILLARRRHGVPSTTGNVRLPRQRTGSPLVVVDSAASWTVDRALRVLVTAVGGGAVPPVYGVSVDDERITVRLVVPGVSAPAPWVVQEGGRRWVAELRDLQALPADVSARTPCPRLVTLGTLYGTRELVDLGQAPGVIGIAGDGDAAAVLVAAWAAELTSSPWSDGVRVVAGTLGHVVAPSARVASVPTVAEALTAAEGDSCELGVLLLGAVPSDRELERVQALASRAEAAWAVVVLGRTGLDRWRFTLREDGRLDTGPLGLLVLVPGITAGSGG
ncbi:hypothetical protein AB0J80_21915 [Actinoplanes sp. NPDC049548]|uniref:LysM peptidoglycan-binding domain-containing protein n=1 Tax=Actinoplanes sp. NPDC049548 TaxID=3155152 RepID=UPI00341F9E99